MDEFQELIDNEYFNQNDLEYGEVTVFFIDEIEPPESFVREYTSSFTDGSEKFEVVTRIAFSLVWSDGRNYRYSYAIMA